MEKIKTFGNVTGLFVWIGLVYLNGVYITGKKTFIPKVIRIKILGVTMTPQ